LSKRPGKILMVEIGSDEHDRSAQAVAAHLRDGGMEVVFTGQFTAAEALARSALEEDVDLIALCGAETEDKTKELPTGEITAALERAGMPHVGLITALAFDETMIRRLHDLVEASRVKRSGLS
jgi:methylmalonyl-CoA mutase cobalamin-binding domain/chain